MVGLGTLFIALTLYGVWLRRRGTLFHRRWLLWVFVFAVLGPYASNQLGWVLAEVGRQPWTVFNLLRTSESFSPSVSAGQVLSSLLLFGVVYVGLGLVWIYVMNAKIQAGPPEEAPPGTTRGKDLLDVAARYEEPGRGHLARGGGR
jgi:cytochrome d ubiquinol oxidase subunit I